MSNDAALAPRLKLTEIFYSLQGESTLVGLPTVFVRLTGCPLRCGYCDSEYAFYGGDWYAFDDIMTKVAAFSCKRVCVTGGEPLAQKHCRAFLQRLCDEGYQVSLETSGAMPIDDLPAAVVRVVDVKTPDSGEQSKNRLENLPLLTAHDQVKFVLCSRSDYEWSREFVRDHGLIGRCEVLFSPCHGQVAPNDLANWILADRLNVRFQFQLHKLLWGDAPGH